MYRFSKSKKPKTKHLQTGVVQSKPNTRQQLSAILINHHRSVSSDESYSNKTVEVECLWMKQKISYSKSGELLLREEHDNEFRKARKPPSLNGENPFFNPDIYCSQERDYIPTLVLACDCKKRCYIDNTRA